MQAASRRAEREAYRNRRALEKRRQEYERMEAFERVRYEVEVYENHIDFLLSIHKECGATWDWHTVAVAPPPAVPTRQAYHEQSAHRELESFTPSFWDQLFGRTETKRSSFGRCDRGRTPQG
jgi:hypothetical protein